MLPLEVVLIVISLSMSTMAANDFHPIYGTFEGEKRARAGEFCPGFGAGNLDKLNRKRHYFTVGYDTGFSAETIVQRDMDTSPQCSRPCRRSARMAPGGDCCELCNATTLAGWLCDGEKYYNDAIF